MEREERVGGEGTEENGLPSSQCSDWLNPIARINLWKICRIVPVTSVLQTHCSGLNMALSLLIASTSIENWFIDVK